MIRTTAEMGWQPRGLSWRGLLGRLVQGFSVTAVESEQASAPQPAIQRPVAGSAATMLTESLRGWRAPIA